MSDPVTPTDTPAAQAAAGGDQPAANLRRVFAMHSASPPEDIAGGDRSPAINRVIASLAGGYCSTNLDVRDVRCLVVAFTDAVGIIDALNSQLSSARADLARLRAPADLAAIEARAADLATLRAKLRAYLDDRARSVFDIPVVLIQERDEAERASAADVPALLAHIAAERERHVAEVAAARAEERARCAAVCDAIGDALSRAGDRTGAEVAYRCAAAPFAHDAAAVAALAATIAKALESRWSPGERVVVDVTQPQRVVDAAATLLRDAGWVVSYSSDQRDSVRTLAITAPAP